MELLPEYFFDLSDYAHRLLFANCEVVWEALNNLKAYLNNIPLGKIEVPIPQGVYLINSELISIGKGTLLEPGAYIAGPCIIGENCQVRHGAYIRGDVITGNNCVIGHDTEVKHSIFLNKAQAAHFAYVGDSILGNQVNLGAGTKCANLRLDHALIHLYIEGKKINTGLKKFGAIIGDHAQLGCNSVTNPGTLIGQHSCVYPCTNIGGLIPPHHAVKSSSPPVVSPL